MRLKRYIFLIFALFAVVPVTFAQKDIRQQIRKGNKAYQDSIYRDAEIAYRKAIDASPKENRAIAHYNLGNTLYNQNKPKDALKEYEIASKYTTDDTELANIYHNMGVVHQSQKEFGEAIENYKQALMKNPSDDETRFNLAMLLKQQEQQQDQKEDKQDDKKDDKKEDNKDKQKQNQDQKDQKEDKKDDKQNQPQPNPQEISKDAADKLLEAVMREEQKTQEKVQKQQVVQSKEKLEKEW